MEIEVIVAVAVGANFGVVHGFDNFHGTEFLNSTSPAEGKMAWVIIMSKSIGFAL